MTAPARRDNVPLGIGFMVVATALFAVSNAIAKWEVALYPTGEVLFFRSVSTFVVVAAFLLPMRGFGVFATSRPRDHLARGLSQSISQSLTVLALSLLPLAAATAISFSAPLFAACVAIIFLGEKVSAERWAVLILGFVGVLVVARPDPNMPLLGAAFALGNAVMYGSVTVAVRGMSKTESAQTLLVWQTATVAFFHTCLLTFGFVAPAPVDFALLVGCGAANAAAQYCWTRALVEAPTSAVSPFYYLLLVWSMAIGYLAWGDVPTPALLAGSAIIVVSGLLLLWRESRPRPAASQAAVRPADEATR
ncbi:MAG TPA: DMT family transporter [Beijerinckiaceae bacterium]